MDSPRTSHLKSVIANLKKLRPIPPVYIYTITHQDNDSISAVDVEHNLNLAYSLSLSRDIYVKLNHNSEEDFTGSLNDAWTKHVARRKLNEKNKTAESSEGSPQVHVFQHGAVVTGLQFTLDGNFLLSCGLDSTIKAWSAISLQLVESYCGNSGFLSDIHVSSDSTSFVTSLRLNNVKRGSPSSEIAMYKFDKKSPISTFRGHAGDIECVRFHPNGLYIASVSTDRTIKLWCNRTSKEVRSFYVRELHEGYPKKLAFSPDGKYLSSASYESVSVWDLASGSLFKCIQIPNSSPGVLNICYDAVGNVLATGGSNKMLHMWDMKSASQESSDKKPDEQLLKCDNLHKGIHCIKCTSNLFTCVTA